MSTDLTYSEEIESVSPSTAGCSPSDGKSTRTWLLEELFEADDIQTALTEVLGYTETEVSSDGRLTRVLPLADPQFLYWFANAIISVQGYGQCAKEDAEVATPPAVVPSFGAYALYQQYRVRVESGPRPYVVMPDDNIDVSTGTYWPTDGGASQSFEYAEEWNRYTDFDFVPRNEYVTQHKGTMKFVSTNATVDGKAFPSSPRMFLPDQIFKVTWYAVPLRFVLSANSYVERFRGRVNQNDWDGPAGLMAAGSLLYLGYNTHKYTPPVQDFSAITPGVYSPEKLCNLELLFLETSRTATDAPSSPPSGNKNFVVGGNNLLPWYPDRKFHYAESLPVLPVGTAGTATLSTPSFFSMPVELLFTDPDTPQSGFTGE